MKPSELSELRQASVQIPPHEVTIYGGADDSWCNQRFGGSLVYPEPRSTTHSPTPTGHRPFPLEIEL